MTTPLDSRFASGDASPGFLLWRVTNRWQAAVRRALAPHELTHVQFVLLAVLTFADDDLTQSELSRRAGADPMMVSQVIRALAARGLVDRRKDAADGRAVRVRATAPGRELARAANHSVEDVDVAFFGAEARPLADHLAALLDRE